MATKNNKKKPTAASKAKRTTTKLQKSDKTLRFSFSPDGEGDSSLSVGTIAETLRSNMGMEKSVKTLKVNRELRQKLPESKVAFGSRQNRATSDNVEVKSYQRLSDAELRSLSQLDPYVSAIIATRCSQAASCGNPSESRFKKGMRILDLNPLDRTKFENEAEYERELSAREKKMRAIEWWVLNCGTTDQEILDTSFAYADRTFKYCNFRQYIEAQVRNLLTFGRMASQIFRDDASTPIMFRPVPVETIAPVIDRENVFLAGREETTGESLDDVKDYNALLPSERPAAWVQRIDGQNANFFTEDDLKVAFLSKQALFDLNGFPLAPLEQAVFMVFIHQQTLGYLRNQFVKGMAAKGLINLESTNENVQLSDADVEDFKQQFHNFVTRTDNSAVTPVIAGPVTVKYIPLASNPKDMEFLQVEEHVIRALCSAFQISPQEMGYGHLGLPQGGITQSNKQEDIIRGEERGLRNLLDIVFDQINEIMFENFPEARGLFRITYVGVGEDTRDAVVNRQTVEINTTATMNSLYADSEKKDVIPMGGDVPLAPIFHSNVVRYMKYSEFMYHYFGERDAKNKPEYDFIIDPNLNQAYQGLKVQSLEMQQKQAELGLEQQELQTDQLKQQGEAMEQQAQAAQAAPSDTNQQPAGDAADAQGQAQPSQGGEAEKSMRAPTLREKWLQKSQEMKKSERRISSYFQEWLDAHNYPLPE